MLELKLSKSSWMPGCPAANLVRAWSRSRCGVGGEGRFQGIRRCRAAGKFGALGDVGGVSENGVSDIIPCKLTLTSERRIIRVLS